MPKEVFGERFQFLERAELLSFGEIHRLVRLFRDHGVQKVRLTGGEIGFISSGAGVAATPNWYKRQLSLRDAS
jgi:hypothetical protein